MTPGARIIVYATGSTIIDAIAASAVLFRRRPGEPGAPTIGLRRLLGASMAMAASFLIKAPIWRIRGVDAFGWIHLAYTDLVVLLPALGAVLWLAAPPIAGGRPWIRLTPAARLAATAALALAPVGVYATWIEPFRLRLESAHLEVSPRRAGHDPVQIGVITDIQTGRVTDYERRAIDRLMAQTPDLILIAGDVFQGSDAEFEASRSDLHELLGRLSAPGGVFLVLGDTDDDGGRLREVLRGTAIRLLVDETATVELGDRRLTIGGIELDYRSLAARSLVDRLESTPGDDDIRIVLAHRPDVVLGMHPDSRIDLVVAGHTHGGQIVIPGFGPPMTLSRVPRPVAAGGLHRVGGNAIYVGRGVGHERGQAPRIRFLCPPEVAVVEIGRRRTDSGDETGADLRQPRWTEE